MSTPIIVTIAICVIALLAFLIYYYQPKTIILRRLKHLPSQRIGSLKTKTYSKVEGKALNIEEPLIAPLSKRKCVFYKMKIQKKVSTGKSSHWKTIVQEEHVQDFFIEQTGERIVVLPTESPKNYYDYLVTDKKTSSGLFKELTPEFAELLKAYNIKTENILGFNKQLRYSEAIVEVGERITVAGYVNWMKLDNPVKDYKYSSIASVTAKGKDKILITDSPDALKPKHGRV
ncbi:hypothetical protein DIS18_06130 [Algibacter marinivivus]|uniref:RING-type E3 ubiquitin transferase n=1 Tax=Algibacter marinivivus TaxID=2100723 RepID=A0A2U2X8K4_9FLAO|nr:hypothetical protein [Algibacter marinivivus]PWH84118.1 hypothetical protein DIS18_06130 [Algibacter marinivivus]